VGNGTLSLTLVVVFDDFPDEVGWILRQDTTASDATPIIAFKPPRSYGRGLAKETITETIAIPESGDFTFYFTDSFGDGMCCSYGQGLYTLYLGPPSGNQVLATGNGSEGRSEVSPFTIGDGETPPQTSPPVTAPTPLTIYIEPDNFPQYIGWKIRDSNNIIVHQRPAGYLTSSQLIQEQVILSKDSLYKFIISDAIEDGLCCSDGLGNYHIRNSNGFLHYGGKFEATDESYFVTEGDFELRITINTDRFPEEIGWRLERLDLEAVASVALVPPTFYTTQLAVIEEDLLVARNGLYRLTVDDSISDGICCQYGSGSIVVSTVSPTEETIFSDDGRYGEGFTRSFVLQPLTPPTNPQTLRLEIQMDQWPSEIFWFLLQGAGDVATARSGGSSPKSVVAFGPSSPYGTDLIRTTVTESIAVERAPAGGVLEFTFVLLDSGNDGLCCSYGKGEYRLFDADNKLIFSSDASGLGREEKSFLIAADGSAVAGTPAPTPFSPPSSSAESPTRNTRFLACCGLVFLCLVM